MNKSMTPRQQGVIKKIKKKKHLAQEEPLKTRYASLIGVAEDGEENVTELDGEKKMEKPQTPATALSNGERRDADR